MFPRESKMYLTNLIRHTNTHNRILEEEECWKQRCSEMASKQNSAVSRSSTVDFLDQSNRRGSSRMPKAHMDCEDDIRRNQRYEGREEKVDTFWTRQLEKAESEDPDRWGHSGYKELYPQDFVSDSEDKDGKERKKCEQSKKSKEKKKKKSKKRKRNDDSDDDKDCTSIRHKNKKRKESEDTTHTSKKKRHKRH